MSDKYYNSRFFDKHGEDEPIGTTALPVITTEDIYRPAPIRKMQDYISGGWKSGRVIIDLDFSNGVYTQYIGDKTSTYTISYISGQGNEIIIKIGGSTVEVRIDIDGTLVLKKNLEMKFLSLSKQRKICPKCFCRNLDSTQSCSECGYKWQKV